jgi:GNAT superfamily N-acetyltransferase
MPVPQFIQRQGEAAAFVAECAGQILGHVAVRYGLGGPEDEEELTTRWAQGHGCAEEDVRVIAVLFTDPAWAGKGVGSGLFRVATEAATANGGRACLDCLDTNTGALEFYKRRGWEIIGEWDAPWVPGLELNVYLMILPTKQVKKAVATSGTDSPAVRTPGPSAAKAAATAADA